MLTFPTGKLEPYRLSINVTIVVELKVSFVAIGTFFPASQFPTKEDKHENDNNKQYET
jgi:hypothetical protein